MKKILPFLFVLFFVGCVNKISAIEATEEYLKKYQTLNEQLMFDLDELIKVEDLTFDQQISYKKALIRQYQNLSYQILESHYNADVATVEAKITVYDYFQSNLACKEYYNQHPDEFMVNNEMNKEYYNDKRIEALLKETKKIDHIITINLVYQNDAWHVSQPSKETLEKIHGIYNYHT